MSGRFKFIGKRPIPYSRVFFHPAIFVFWCFRFIRSKVSGVPAFPVRSSSVSWPQCRRSECTFPAGGHRCGRGRYPVGIWMTSIGKIVFSSWIDNRDRKPSLAPFAFPAWCGKIKIERCSVSHEIYAAPYQHPAVSCERLGWCTGIHDHCGTAGTHLDFLERPCQRPVYCHFGHEYGYFLYSSLIPYDYYSSLSSFATVDLAESHIFGWFLTENLLRINIPRLVDTSILLNSDCSFLTWKYPQSSVVLFLLCLF